VGVCGSLFAYEVDQIAQRDAHIQNVEAERRVA
jgi:hypothetical protein